MRKLFEFSASFQRLVSSPFCNFKFFFKSLKAVPKSFNFEGWNWLLLGSADGISVLAVVWIVAAGNRLVDSVTACSERSLGMFWSV